ncbi:cytochrome C oxidase subunit IV family protein [Diaphorobacter aerolatus]|uniref:Cytochrome C oxidase subunit IV family protein n=1 Tax=Diaphorobacter aerolatus TaxID=1288495 RepID=A0A7H0GKJ6_9BURK|nr:cytochrome C oxidase subunit IV family protein [Diaphorobacter aerolatus]QNP48812.1 cytochrome C oxidase subunit IV family protein [Diaphorobacter aerolatus]
MPLRNEHANATRRIHLAWAILIITTLSSWWLAEDPAALRLGLVSTGIVLALSALKGVVIALDFMELLQAPRLWRRAVLGWLATVLLIIFLTRFIS